jgi:hypothetical protein
MNWRERNTVPEQTGHGAEGTRACQFFFGKAAPRVKPHISTATQGVRRSRKERAGTELSSAAAAPERGNPSAAEPREALAARERVDLAEHVPAGRP